MLKKVVLFMDCEKERNDKSLNDAPFLERKADITTQVSMTINDFILVLYAIPTWSQDIAFY